MDGSKESPIVYFDPFGNGPMEHVCADGGPIDRIRDWLDRQRLTGISTEGARVIEQLIEDIS